jgi:cellulose synthase operon protein C
MRGCSSAARGEDGAANNLAMLLVTHRNDTKSLQRAATLAERFATSEVPGLIDTYGWVKFKRGEYAEAVRRLQRAVDKAPESPELRYHLAWLR